VLLHLDIIEVFYSPTDAEESCFKRNIKIYIKTAPTCFVLIAIIRERIILATNVMRYNHYHDYYNHSHRATAHLLFIIIIIIVSCRRPFLPGTSLESAVIPTAQASSFTLLHTAVLSVLCVMFQV
jgi:uncharacterized membrane protein YcgQ (UPF0703/DUF1980 family)